MQKNMQQTKEESIFAFFHRVRLQQEQQELLDLQWYVVVCGIVVSILRGVSYWYAPAIAPPFLFLFLTTGWILVLILLRYDWAKLSSVIILLLLVGQSVEMLRGSFFFMEQSVALSTIYALVGCFFAYFLFPYIDDKKKKRRLHLVITAAWIAILVFLSESYLPLLIFASHVMIAWVDALKERFIKSEADALQRVASLTDEVEGLKARILQQEQTFSMQQKKIEQQKELLEKQYDEVMRRSGRIRFYSKVLWTMAHYKFVREGLWRESIEYLLLTAAETISVTRLSLWKWHERNHKLHLMAFYEEQKGCVLFEKEEVLLRGVVDRLSGLIVEQHWCVESIREIDIEDDDAFRDYLQRHRIVSFMWLPIVREDRLYGLLCFENQDERRGWEAEDVLFARSVVDVFDMVQHAAERRAFQEEIKRQKEEIEEQNALLKRQQEETLAMNRNLEALVQERTHQLEVQNKQLAEYAFVNAHLLRGPLCNILGMIQILEQEENQTPEQLNIWLPLLKEAISRLDEIVQKIAHFLDDKGFFDRYDLKPERYRHL